MLDFFAKPGKASFIVGGQWGSEGKGAAAAYLSVWHNRNRDQVRGFDIATTNAGAQAGHTSTVDGVKKVVFHLPTYSLYRPCFTYLNAGSIIDPKVLMQELADNSQVLHNGFAIHPNAAIITDECRAAEGRDDSAQTKIASTRKGVGEALARKVLRSGIVAGQFFKGTVYDGSGHIRVVDLNEAMLYGKSVLCEVPQGHSLSLDGPFYPHTTSRNCTVGQAMSDAGVHPDFYHRSMLVVRTYPIRVGNIERPTPGDHITYLGTSGGHFPDQRETTWEELGQPPEITTVTKRVRRVFTFSEEQVAAAIAQTRPSVIYLSFCDYLPTKEVVQHKVELLRVLSHKYGQGSVEILTAWGPTTDDVKREPYV